LGNRHCGRKRRPGRTGEVGELVVRGRASEVLLQQSAGHRGNSQDGWLFTGDVARMTKRFISSSTGKGCHYHAERISTRSDRRFPPANPRSRIPPLSGCLTPLGETRGCDHEIKAACPAQKTRSWEVCVDLRAISAPHHPLCAVPRNRPAKSKNQSWAMYCGERLGRRKPHMIILADPLSNRPHPSPDHGCDRG
jgi:hypothetical protein